MQMQKVVIIIVMVFFFFFIHDLFFLATYIRGIYLYIYIPAHAEHLSPFPIIKNATDYDDYYSIRYTSYYNTRTIKYVRAQVYNGKTLRTLAPRYSLV